MPKNTAVDVLKSVTEAILKHEDVKEILFKTVQLISSDMNLACCCIYSYDRERDLLVLEAGEGFEKDMRGSKLAVTEGITGHVFSTHCQVNIVNPEKHPAYVYVEGTGEQRFHSYLGVPMIVGNSCVGVLTLQSIKRRRFSEDVADLAVNLASQLAMVIGSADAEEIFKDHSILESEEETLVQGSGEVKFSGVSVCDGIVHAPVFRLQSDVLWQGIKATYVEDREEEMERLKLALEKAKQETTEIQERAAKVFIEADASIFFAQLLFLEDPNLVSDIEFGIDFHGMSAASSVKLTIEKYIEKFRSSNDVQLMERAMDLMDIGLRVVAYLVDTTEYPRPGESQKMIFVGDEIMPSDLIRLSSENILGIACSLGGSTSHAAILARSLNIPAIMGLEGLTEGCNTGDSMLIDGEENFVIVNPSEETLKAYEGRLGSKASEIIEVDLQEPTFTLDGESIRVMGNVCMVSDFTILNRIYNDGVGLYRTEFMYMMHDSFPSENEQYRIYRSVAKLASPNSVTVRALDIGGDKPLKYFDNHDETDPMLGFRSIRILLEHREIFEPHLRAMLRASQRGNMKLLFPMVAHYEDIIAIKKILAEVMADLTRSYGRSFKMPPIGAMIEMPSTVWQIDEIFQEVDYVSIGTNDLVQYMFAVDRGNTRVENYFKPMHPIILKTLKHIVKRGKKFGKDVSICGEVAGNPYFTPLLLGLGLREVSMIPPAIAKIKPLIHKLKVSECRSLVNKVLKYKTEKEVHDHVKSFLAERDLTP